MEAFGCFPVERGTGDRNAVGAAAKLIDDGEVLGIFPRAPACPTATAPGSAAPPGSRS